MQLNINTLSKTKIIINISNKLNNITCEEFLTNFYNIYFLEGIDSSNINLIYKQPFINDDFFILPNNSTLMFSLLEDNTNTIKEEDIVIVEMFISIKQNLYTQKKNNNDIGIFVKTDLKTLYFKVPCDISIKNLKLILFEKTKVPFDMSRLSYSSKILNNSLSINNYNITNDSTLFMDFNLYSTFAKYERFFTNSKLIINKQIYYFDIYPIFNVDILN